MTFVVVAIIAILILLVMMRLSAKARGTGSSVRTTQNRRTGRDRREAKIRVPFERRRRPRRLDDVAADYVSRLDTRHSTGSPSSSRR